jgi:hypothetical protein
MMHKITSVFFGILSLGLSIHGAEQKPQWTSIGLNGQGQLELSFNAPSEQTYIIEASGDLVQWQVVSDPILTSNEVTDWIAPESDAGHRFYRLALFDRDWMRSQFERNRRLWNEQALSDYSYVFNWSCFCLPEYTAPVNIRVEQGEWTEMSFVLDGKPVIEENWQRYKTIDELFEIIDDAFRQDAKEIHATYDPDLGYPTSVFIDYSELIADEERGFNVDLQKEPAIQFLEQTPEALESDGFRLLDAKIEGDLLEIQVEYGGGCRVHQLEMVANPAAFMESEPIQSNIYLSHESHNDPCKALVRKKITFSLKPLKEVFLELYPARDSLILNIHGFHLNEEQRMITVPYQLNR